MFRLKIGLIMGSTRDGRLCDRVTKFVKNAVEKQHEVVVLDPESMDLPKTQQSVNFLMDPSASRVPQNIKDLNELIKTIDGFILITPEYNWCLPPGLTDLMDNIPPTTWCWKPTTFVHYAMSPVGGWRVGMQLRIFAGALGLIVVPKQMGIPMAQNVLTVDGAPNNERLDKELKTLLEHLYWNINAFKNHAKGSQPPNWSM